MAGPRKAAATPPIDRPLAKAYLRKFTGWSTAYPPGMADPTSLRVMHNCNVDADGSLRIRPGLRRVFNAPLPGDLVGSFEHFYVPDGRKALLFSYRNPGDNKVRFTTAVYNSATNIYDVDPSISTRFGAGATDALLDFNADTTYVKYLQIDNKILALSDNDQSFRMFWVGGAPQHAGVPQKITVPTYTATDKPTIIHPDDTWVAGAQTAAPTAETPAATTLISSTVANNIYNFAYFYTFSNEIGESMSSMVGWVKVQRRWTVWAADPAAPGTVVADPTKYKDQLAITIPQAAYNTALGQGAVQWNLYWATWSDQDNVPIEAQLLKSVPMVGKTWAQAGWTTHTALLQGLDALKELPYSATQENFSNPSTASQGLVAGDRLVLVYDKLNAARIQWTSNQQGNYLDFSASKGGGYKTLTSGNLFVPAAVKLWQNPQSVDTITVLCLGLDGYGTAYYMNPSTQISTQSQQINVMGFEETTATPGTVSPYGCEVLNNALFHPLDNNLMKSSASNYNINHAMMADAIQNIWHQIPTKSKQRIVSSQLNTTLYYLVQSPVGWIDSLQNGNQIWMCDTGQTNLWSCWDVEGTSLRKLEIEGLLYMGITSGPSLFVFDPEQDHDDVWDGSWKQAGIPWEAVTNTQGANRAHDVWALVQQVNVTFGNFTGECVYGIRGKDVNGSLIEVQKHYVAPTKGHNPLDRYDEESFLLIRRIMREWEFFWRSADKPKNRSYGSVCYVQYRTMPVSVNVGYEYGSIETFEYGDRWPNYSNGTPIPFADTLKP